MNTRSLKEVWHTFREANPKTRIRDAATQLGVSEAELLATGCGETCTSLRPDWHAILTQLHTLGNVMALTRSDAMVHEVHGVFTEPHFHGDTALFFRPGLDTRYFLGTWKHAYAVNENGRLSLQFFDAYGTAAHKVYLHDTSHLRAYHQLVDDFRTPQQRQHLHVEKAVVARPAPLVNMSLDISDLRKAWSEIRDVHEGNRIIKQLGGNRQAIYRTLGKEYADILSNRSVETLLTALAEQQIPLMLFGMNDSAVQSYGGTISKLLQTGPWFNVLDPGFNLHLRTGEIGAVWRIRKPSDDGWVTSLDVFDTQGNEIMVITDNRRRGETESTAWAELLLGLR